MYYRLSDGSEYTSGLHSYFREEEKVRKEFIIEEEDEYIVEIGDSSGEVIDRIRIKTNKGRVW